MTPGCREIFRFGFIPRFLEVFLPLPEVLVVPFDDFPVGVRCRQSTSSPCYHPLRLLLFDFGLPESDAEGLALPLPPPAEAQRPEHLRRRGPEILPSTSFGVFGLALERVSSGRFSGGLDSGHGLGEGGACLGKLCFCLVDREAPYRAGRLEGIARTRHRATR